LLLTRSPSRLSFNIILTRITRGRCPVYGCQIREGECGENGSGIVSSRILRPQLLLTRPPRERIWHWRIRHWKIRRQAPLDVCNRLDQIRRFVYWILCLQLLLTRWPSRQSKSPSTSSSSELRIPGDAVQCMGVRSKRENVAKTDPALYPVGQ
jgi:hypothetical protein